MIFHSTPVELRKYQDDMAFPVSPTNGNLGLPADLLITGDGEVAAVKYGTHAHDQWPVDELLTAVRGLAHR